MPGIRAASETLFEYHAFGLFIRTSIELPELKVSYQPVDDSSFAVQISEVEFSHSLFESDGFDNGFRFENRQLFMRVDAVGYFHVPDENTIYFQRDPDLPPNVVQDKDVRVFLLGSCMGAVLQLRGFLPLHASVVSVNGAALAFTGHSGAGKSTTLAMLSSREHRVLTDDVAAIDTRQIQPMVLPAYPQIKLNDDSVRTLGIPDESIKWINRFRSKYSKRCDNTFSDDACPLHSIFLINTGSDNQNATVRELKGSEKFAAIMRNTYRQFFHKHLCVHERVAEQVMLLCQQCHVYELYRPANLSATSLTNTREAIYHAAGITNKLQAATHLS